MLINIARIGRRVKSTEFRFLSFLLFAVNICLSSAIVRVRVVFRKTRWWLTFRLPER